MMYWPAFLLTLLANTQGLWAQDVLSQPSSLARSLKETVSISCLGGSDNIGRYHVNWYQERQGSTPTKVIHESTNRPSGVPNRFSGSVDRSARTASLTISDLQPEDEATYYCQSYNRRSIRIFGGGTQLNILDQPKASPSVTLFPPSSEELLTNEATMVCLVNGFYPATATVNWKADEATVTQGVKNTQPSRRSDNKYMVSSYLTMTPDEWRTRGKYTCQVVHEGETVEKSLSPAESS